MLTSDQGMKNSALQPVSVRAEAPCQAPSHVLLNCRSGRIVPSETLPPRDTWNQ